MTERMICVDINFSGDQRETIERIRERVANRKPRKGSLVYRNEQRRSALRGGEVGLLKKLAALEVTGKIESVDAIFEGGINIVAVVDEGEETRLRGNSSYTVVAGLRAENDVIIMRFQQ